MAKFTVHLYREMRLSFAGVEADSPQAAATAVSNMPTGDADDIQDCEGENLAALIDLAGDEDYRQSVTIDFEAERQRKAAPVLLAALESIIDYAEGEAYSLDKLKDSPEAEAEAERAWKSIETAQEVIAQAKTAGITAAPPGHDIDALLARDRQIAIIWSIEDVEEMRPDLTDDQCWEVLQAARRGHDATIGINWDVLSCHADMLHGDAPEADEAEEA